MIETHPRRRDDLEVAERVVDDETVYTVGDPIQNAYHELDELQWEVLQKLDGKTSLADVVRWLVEEHEIEVDLDELGEFIDNLRELNLLDVTSGPPLSAEEGRAIAARVRRQLVTDGVVFARRGQGTDRRDDRRGDRRTRHLEANMMDAALHHLAIGEIRMCASYLRTVLDMSPHNQRARYLFHVISTEHFKKDVVGNTWVFYRLPLVNPDELLGKIDAVVGRFLFTRASFVAWLFLMAWAAWLLATNYERAVDHVARIVQSGDVALISSLFIGNFVANLLLTVGHEMAHGLSCKHFGGRAREMGLLFAYMMPGAYCDVSSTYIFESRMQRAWVSLMGPVFDFSAAAAFIFLYHFGSPDTWLVQLSLFLVPVLLYGTLVNLHPLIKNDGYLVLTDMLDYPNLRDEAFSYLKHRVEGLLLGVKRPLPDGIRGHRDLLLWYSVPAIALTTLLVVFGTYYCVRLLLERLYAPGLVIATLLVSVVAYRTLKPLFAALWRERHALVRSRRFYALSAAGLTLVIAIPFAPVPSTIEAPFDVAYDAVAVRAPEPGVLRQLLVADGEEVTQGAPLAVISNEALARTRLQASAELAAAEQALALLLEGSSDAEVDVARAVFATARTEVARAERDVSRLRRLARGNLVARDALDAAQANLAAAHTSRSTALQSLRAIAAGAEDERVVAAQSTVALKAAALERLEEQLASLALSAPHDGIVRWRLGDRFERLEGRRVDRGEVIIDVERPERARLEAHVPLSEPVDRLVPGVPVEARLVGVPELPLSGTLAAVAPQAERDPLTGQVFVRVAFDLPQAPRRRLSAGLTGTLVVDLGWIALWRELQTRTLRVLEIDLERALAGADQTDRGAALTGGSGRGTLSP